MSLACMQKHNPGDSATVPFIPSPTYDTKQAYSPSLDDPSPTAPHFAQPSTSTYDSKHAYSPSFDETTAPLIPHRHPASPSHDKKHPHPLPTPPSPPLSPAYLNKGLASSSAGPSSLPAMASFMMSPYHGDEHHPDPSPSPHSVGSPSANGHGYAPDSNGHGNGPNGYGHGGVNGGGEYPPQQPYFDPRALDIWRQEDYNDQMMRLNESRRDALEEVDKALFS